MKGNCRGGGFLSRCHTTAALALTLSFVFPFSPRRARSGARRWQCGIQGGRWPLPLGHPPRSPPPRLLIRERRVPGGLAAPLPAVGSAAAPPGDSSPWDGRCTGGRAAAPSVRGWPRLPRAGIVLAAGYAVQTPPRATRLSPATIAPGTWPGTDGAPRGCPGAGGAEPSGRVPPRAFTGMSVSSSH